MHSDETQSSVTGSMHVIYDSLDKNHTDMWVAACIFLFVMVATNLPNYSFCSPNPDVSFLVRLDEEFSQVCGNPFPINIEKKNTSIKYCGSTLY